MISPDELENTLRLRLIERGQELFREEMASGFARVRRLGSDTSRYALGALLSASPSVLEEWALILPAADSDPRSASFNSVPRRAYLAAVSEASRKDAVMSGWSLKRHPKPSRPLLICLRREIRVNLVAAGLEPQRLDPTSRYFDKHFGPISVRTIFGLSGSRFDYGHRVSVNGREVLPNFHFMAWLGLTTTEWDISPQTNVVDVARDFVSFVELFLREVGAVVSTSGQTAREKPYWESRREMIDAVARRNSTE